MKKVLKNLLIIIICFVVCACSVKNENTITIDKNGKFTYNVIVAFDKSLIETLIKTDIIKTNKDVEKYINDNIKDNYLDGFTKKEYSNEEYVGNEYVYEVDNIDNISTTSNIAVILNKNSVVGTNMFKKKDGVYRANFLYNLNDKYNYKDVDFLNTFTVNLPVKALSSNADQILNDGKTLVWNIKNGDSKAINFQFSFDNIKSSVSYGFIIIDVLIIAVFVIVLIKRKRENEEEID